ncbi:bifunctional diguanylate cyclase/phosphodiesterase [Aliikangiella sp. G2MR2-5]|uniref:putative bifunctional diguanylate cyclase/phosphodiesterase n=1 Tax=Aliikangiella sp. G2MR2-5 TaxID=2788943 RepID=UPI0018A9C848|nr:EAL domain-containing protein [Aliikangiella sp. G2MR2-5]
MTINPGDNTEKELLAGILLQLDIAAFEYIEGKLIPISTPPNWFDELYLLNIDHQHKSSEYLLSEAFPFIENFIYDAKNIWQCSNQQPLRSGLWSECLDDLYELNLEAIAMKIGNHSLLLIANETSHFELRRKVYQNARNLALKNERLESSIQLHQRQLQQQLEKLYKKDNSFDGVDDDIENESTAVLICRHDGSVEVFNKALIDIYAMSEETRLSEKSLLKKWSEEAERQYPEIHRVLQSGQHWEGEFETFDNNHRKKWVRLMIAPVFDQNNELEHYICVANDISNIKLSAKEIELLTQIDPNTHLPNRRSFWNYLTEQIDKSQETGTSLALLYLDLDHFKQVNDDLGPEQADFLLNAVANRLKQCLKKQDFIAHLGGDEFAVVIKNIVDQQSLSKIAQRIRENIYRDISFGDFTLNVSTSIGIAIYPQHGLKPNLLVKNADYAMYHAKEMGRNQFQFSSPYSKRHIKRKIHIEQGLKSALSNNEFKLLYQPQISLEKQGQHRIEALIRWHHPNHGTITPADFISIAEESGIIIDIGRWVLETACKEIKSLNKKGYSAKISINVSPKQFKYSSIIDEVKAALEYYKVDPSQLELEVTESVFLDDLEQVIKQLELLKGLGVTLALDDFGTGYSSLNYIKQLPIDILKIDRSFISELPFNRHGCTIVESIIAMSHQLSIEVVAEGIETKEQLEYLRNLGCDFVQGYLFYAPLSSEELISLYQSLQPKQ